MTESKRIAITGVTSGVGRRLAEMALDRGYEVRGLIRSPDREDARDLASRGVQLVKGDLLDVPSIDRLCEDRDAIIHCAAYVGDWGPRESFKRVNVDGTRHVVEAAARAKAKRLIHVSSVAVYGRPDRGRILETYPRTKTGVPYDDTKVDAEILAFEHGAHLGLEVAALRPPVIYGPYDRNFIPRSISLISNNRFRFVGDGHNSLNVVWVDHVGEVCLLALDHPQAVGEAFNIVDTVDRNPPSLRQVAAAIAKGAGLNAPSKTVPYAVAISTATVLNALYKLVGSSTPPPLTPFVVRLTQLDVIYDASKARDKLGWQPAIQPLEGIERFARLLTDR